MHHHHWPHARKGAPRVGPPWQRRLAEAIDVGLFFGPPLLAALVHRLGLAPSYISAAWCAGVVAIPVHIFCWAWRGRSFGRLCAETEWAIAAFAPVNFDVGPEDLGLDGGDQTVDGPTPDDGGEPR